MTALQQIVEGIKNLFTWILIVAPWEQAVRVRFGSRVTLLHAGVHLRLPFFDRVYRQSIRRRLGIIRPQTITTNDGKVLTLSGVLGFSIVDLLKLYDTLEHAQDTVDAEVASSISTYCSGVTLEECRPRQIEEYVRGDVHLEKYGLAGQEFFVTSFAVVRTYRLITGDLPAYNYGRFLDTQDAESRSA